MTRRLVAGQVQVAAGSLVMGPLGRLGLMRLARMSTTLRLGASQVQEAADLLAVGLPGLVALPFGQMKRSVAARAAAAQLVGALVLLIASWRSRGPRNARSL